MQWPVLSSFQASFSCARWWHLASPSCPGPRGPALPEPTLKEVSHLHFGSFYSGSCGEKKKPNRQTISKNSQQREGTVWVFAHCLLPCWGRRGWHKQSPRPGKSRLPRSPQRALPPRSGCRLAGAGAALQRVWPLAWGCLSRAEPPRVHPGHALTHWALGQTARTPRDSHKVGSPPTYPHR